MAAKELAATFYFKKQISRWIKQEVTLHDESPLKTEYNLIVDSSKATGIRITWALTLIFCTAICIFQTYDRTHFYLSQPTSVNVAVDKHDTLIAPDLIFANLHTEAFRPFWPRGEDNIPIDNVMFCSSPMVTFLKDSQNAPKNSTILWLASNVSVCGISLNIDRSGKTISKVTVGNNSVQGNNYFQLHEEYGPEGLLSVVKIRRPLKVGSTVCAVLRKCGLCTFQMLILYFKNDFSPYRYYIQKGRYGANIVCAISRRQYNFVNRRHYPCEVDFKKAAKCFHECLAKKYQTINCSFPFTENSVKMKDCSSISDKTDVIERYNKAKSISMQTSATLNCNCTRLCSDTVYFIHTQKETILDKSVLHVQLDLSDPFVFVFDEIIAFDAINLIIDISGNLGLLLGLSILSIIQIHQSGMLYIYYKLTAKSISKEVMSRVKQNSTFLESLKKIPTDSNSNKSLPGLKVLVILLSAILSTYLIFQKSLYYMSEPVKTVVTATEDEVVYHPNIILCGEPSIINMWRKAMSKQIQIPPCQLHFLDLLDLKGRQISPDKLWNEKLPVLDDLTLKGFQRVQGEETTRVNRSTTAMHTGMCHEFAFQPMQYIGELTRYVFCLDKIKKDCKDGLMQVYLRPYNEPIDAILLSERNILANFVGRIAVRTFKMKEMNTKRHSCVEETEFKDCRNRCVEKNIEKLIKCRLPFLTNVNVSMCNDAMTAKQAYAIFLKIAIQTDFRKECQCLPACHTTVFQSFLYYDEPGIPSVIHKTFPLNNFIENFIEEPAYSFVGMICDIGNILGFGLGVSLLSLVHWVQNLSEKVQATFQVKH